MPGYKPSFGGDTPRRRNLTIDVQRKPVSISAETMADIEQIRAVYRASTTENTGSRCALRRAARLGSALGLPPCAPLWLCSGPAAPLSARAAPLTLTLGAASPGPRGPAESLRTALICRAALPVAPPSPDALRPARSGGVKVEKSTGRNAFSFVRKAKPVDMDLSAAGIRSLTTKDRQKTQYASLRKVFKKMDSDGVRPSPSPPCFRRLSARWLGAREPPGGKRTDPGGARRTNGERRATSTAPTWSASWCGWATCRSRAKCGT